MITTAIRRALRPTADAAVSTGNRFQQAGGISPGIMIWQVRSVFRSSRDNREYATLALLRDPTLVKTIVASALTDRRHFNPASPPERG